MLPLRPFSPPPTPTAAIRAAVRRSRAAIRHLFPFLLFFFACAPPSPRPDAVVLIVVDTLRADRLGCYGRGNAHTPEIDALAAAGTRLTDVTTAVPVTLPAFCTMLTGRWPFHHGVRDNAGFVLPEQETTLAERFQAAGWRTGAILASSVLARDRGLDQGFDLYDDAFRGPYPIYDPGQTHLAEELARNARRATQVTDRALAFVDSAGSDRFFLLAHYFDPHTQYDPPPEFARLHPGDPYQGEISYADAEVGRLVRTLRARRPDAMVVLVADHGEGLGEHGETAHGFLLYQSTVHVPWIVVGPGVAKGAVKEDPVSLVDLGPSIAHWAHLPPMEDVDGRVLHLDRPDPIRPLYLESLRPLIAYDWSEMRGVREGRLKLVRARDEASAEFYDLVQDPDERSPLTLERESATVRARAADLDRRLRDWIGNEDAEAIRSRARSGVDPDRAQRLASLGYLGGGGASTAEPPATRPHPRDRLDAWTERQRRKSVLREAMGLVEAGRFAAGRARLDSVLTHEPDNVDALYYRGLAWQALGDSTRGWADLRRAEALDPDYLPLQLELAAREEESGRVEAAWRRLRRLADRPDADPQVLRTLAMSWLRHGHDAEAIDVLERLLEGGDDASGAVDPRLRLALAEALLRQGRTDEARPHLRELVDTLDANDPLAHRARADLASIDD